MLTLLFAREAGRLAIEAVLRARGHEVRVCHSEEEAWTVLTEEHPWLVVISPVEPERLAFCRRAREFAGQEVTILIVLLEESEAKLQAMLEAGVDDYVMGSLLPYRLHARIAFVERQVEGKRLRERAELESAAHARQQAVLAELGQRVLSGAALPDILDYAAHATAVALGLPFSALLERVPGGEGLLLRAGAGWQDGLVGRAVVEAGPDSHVGFTLLAGGPVVVEDYRREARFGGPALLRDHGVLSGAAVVIQGEQEPFGVLSVHALHPHAFRREDVHFLQAVASTLASAIGRRRAEEALLESEARVRAILETTVDGIITIDERGTVETFNRAAERIFGYEAAEVIGRNVKMLMPSPYYEEHDEYLERYLETGRRKIIGIGREVVGQRKDGSTFPLDLAVSEVTFGGRRIFSGILRDITERRWLEQEILRISEQERRRIGQDLHDGLGQMLTGIGLISQSLARRLRAEGVAAGDDVAEVADLVKQADQYARGLSRGLVPVELEENGLGAALQRLCASAGRLFGIECIFEQVGTPLIYDNVAATHLYRIAQESVSNAAKHGRSTRVTVSLVSGEEQIRLRVQDDGVGFPDVLGEDRGMGVRIMHYRARVIGADLEIRRGPAGGTIVTCTLRRSDRPAARPRRAKTRRGDAE